MLPRKKTDQFKQLLETRIAELVLLRNPPTLPHETEVGSPYCSDPNCQFCKDLRAAHQQLKQGQPVTPSTRGSAA